MADYQQIVDEIRSALALGDDCPQDVIVTLNEQYVEAIRAVNERLRMCRHLLARGQRSEMIRQCNAEPRLLEAVALLDVPKQLSWSEVTSRLSLPALPDLLIEAAIDVNEAFLAEQSLEGLLRSHRLLALARAPLSQRISLLRRISLIEPTNPVWREDLREYEKARTSELADELVVARRQKDPAALARIEQEVRSNTWLQPPPPGFVAQVASARAEVYREAARREMESLVEPLNLAFANFDVALGRELRKRWEAAAGDAPLEEYDALIDAAAPALKWLHEEDQREQGDHQFAAVAGQLDEGLEEEALLEEPERIDFVPRRPDRDVSAVPSERVVERLAPAAVRTRRDRWLLVLLSAVIAAGVVLLPYRYFRNERIERHVSALNLLLREDKFDEAREYLEKLKVGSSWIVSDTRIMDLADALHGAEQKDAERKARLDSLLEEIKIRPGADWQVLTRLHEELIKAAVLVRTDDERARVMRKSSDLAEARVQLEKQSNAGSRR